jgi:3-hydroxyisobutyrate dehydrogenase-like beta-hydroxyacid dehydrogenase
MTAKHVLFLGLGAMGLPMALNLQRNGFTVTGWNRTPGKGEALSAAGGRLTTSLRAAAAEADFIVTMLSDPPAVEAVALGEQGFLGACRPGALWLDASTIGPTVTRHLAEAADARDVYFVDAPVLGSVGPATEGTLHFLAGGTPEAIALAGPLMDAMGSGSTHFGPASSGAAAKIISNMVTATLVAAVGEGLALGERLGLDRAAVATMLGEGPVGSRIVKTKAPAMVSEQFDPAFQLKLMEKDVSLALKEAQQVGASLATAAGTHAEFAAARAAGFGDLDFAAVGAFIRKMAQGPFSR